MAELVDDAVDGVFFERAVEPVVVRTRMIDGLNSVAIPAAAHLTGVGLIAVHHHEVVMVGMGLPDLVGRYAIVDVESVPVNPEIIDSAQAPIVVEGPVDPEEHILDQPHDTLAAAERIDRLAVDADLDPKRAHRLCGRIPSKSHHRGQQGCTQSPHKRQFLSDSSISANSSGV